MQQKRYFENILFRYTFDNKAVFLLYICLDYNKAKERLNEYHTGCFQKKEEYKWNF